MKYQISAIITVIFLLTTMIPISNAIDLDKTKEDKEWYYLPPYPNYAPSGLPDFDQRQDESWRGEHFWVFCGPTAVADVLWYLDSKNSDPEGYPGDGFDNYSLVRNYNDLGLPTPGPKNDDHNFNNINDINTPWDGTYEDVELIELCANYVNIFWYKIPLLSVGGTDRFHLSNGIKRWINDAGLKNDYKVENIFKPSFELINDRLNQDQLIILRLGYYFRNSFFFPIVFAHYVAVAGVHPDGYIAISDPEWDIQNPCEDPMLHNDAAIVSHDKYKIDTNTPCPALSSFWIPDFEVHRRVLVVAAIIISET